MEKQRRKDQYEMIVDVPMGKISSAYVKAPFNEARAVLEENNYKIISLEELAGLSMQNGRNSSIFQTSNHVREGVLYVPKKGVFLTKNSPIIKDSSQLGHYDTLQLSDEQVEEALADSLDISKQLTIDNPEYGNCRELSASEFGRDKISNFLFGKNSSDYGKFLKDADIPGISLRFNSYDKRGDSPFVKQLFYPGLVPDLKFMLHGNTTFYINVPEGIRGILEK